MIELPTPPYQSGLRAEPLEIAFVYNAGGLGDYINWTPGLLHALRTNPHLKGWIVAPGFFSDLARLWFAPFSDRFEIRVCDDLSRLEGLSEMNYVAPNREQYANASNTPFVRLGFIYYAQDSRVPRGTLLPPIRGDEAAIDHFALPENYAVLTPNATMETKRLPAPLLNRIISGLTERGITPVLLGRSEPIGGYRTDSAEGLDLRLVRDLRDGTTTLETAALLARARFVFGLDNGLLHLAACSAVPIIWAFTIASPEFVLPPRQKGARTVLVEPPASLPCRYCNNNIRFALGFDFKTCLHENYLCIKAIDAESILRAVDSLGGPQ